MDPNLLNTASVFLVQVGARFINFNFTDAQKKMIQHPLMQNLILFAMFYIPSRNPWVSLGLLFVYNLCLYYLLNEYSQFNIYNKKWLEQEGFMPSQQKKPIQENYYTNITKVAL
jgi:hypothetical protein